MIVGSEHSLTINIFILEQLNWNNVEGTIHVVTKTEVESSAGDVTLDVNRTDLTGFWFHLTAIDST